VEVKNFALKIKMVCNQFYLRS